MKNTRKKNQHWKVNDFHEYSTKCWSSIKFAKYAFWFVLWAEVERTFSFNINLDFSVKLFAFISTALTMLCKHWLTQNYNYCWDFVVYEVNVFHYIEKIFSILTSNVYIVVRYIEKKQQRWIFVLDARRDPKQCCSFF